MSAADYPYFAPPPFGLAHRGGASHPANVGIENTLAAFATAVDLGYRFLETDVHATADGRLVAFHDEHLDRVTDRAGAIAELPWSEVAAARIAGSQPIPSLDDLLDAFPEARINIDIKAPGAVVPLWETIRRHAAYDRVCVGSFGERRLHAFRRLAGARVATAAGQLGTAVHAGALTRTGPADPHDARGARADVPVGDARADCGGAPVWAAGACLDHRRPRRNGPVVRPRCRRHRQ